MSQDTFTANFDVVMWDAVFKAARYYNDNIGDDLDHNGRYKWMLENWGIDHNATSIEVVDEQKYLMLLLKFA